MGLTQKEPLNIEPAINRDQVAVAFFETQDVRRNPLEEEPLRDDASEMMVHLRTIVDEVGNAESFADRSFVAPLWTELNVFAGHSREVVEAAVFKPGDRDRFPDHHDLGDDEGLVFAEAFVDEPLDNAESVSEGHFWSYSSVDNGTADINSENFFHFVFSVGCGRLVICEPLFEFALVGFVNREEAEILRYDLFFCFWIDLLDRLGLVINLEELESESAVDAVDRSDVPRSFPSWRRYDCANFALPQSTKDKADAASADVSVFEEATFLRVEDHVVYDRGLPLGHFAKLNVLSTQRTVGVGCEVRKVVKLSECHIAFNLVAGVVEDLATVHVTNRYRNDFAVANECDHGPDPVGLLALVRLRAVQRVDGEVDIVSEDRAGFAEIVFLGNDAEVGIGLRDTFEVHVLCSTIAVRVKVLFTVEASFLGDRDGLVFLTDDVDGTLDHSKHVVADFFVV